MEERFLNVIKTLFKHEGGYVNNPRDPGGETKYGISKKAYPDLDIKNLTKEQAAKIYYRDWWKRLKIEQLPDPIAGKVLDITVNVGPVTGVKLLQSALRACGKVVAVDGVIGPETLAAVQSVDPGQLMAAFRSEAAGHYRVLAAQNPALRGFLQGWLSRAYE